MKELKTICFQTRGGVNHNYGGLDRVTELLADYFEKNGFTVYYLSQIKRQGTHATRQVYLPNENNLLSDENIVFYNAFLKEKKIDVLINQEGNVNINLPLNKENKDLIYITVLHFNPNYITEFHFENKFNKMNIPNVAKKVFSGIFKIPFIKKKAFDYLHRKLESNYYVNCLNCDQFVMLSNRFQKDFAALFTTKALPSNITAINNPIQLDNVNVDFSKKKNKLLYVGRLECGMKQLDRLLDNWKIIANKFPDWSLHLVGGGPDEMLLKKQVITESIPRVFFEGIQNPQSYYEEASIFCFSSSSSEGWGMVLVEAQSYGCVPVAFNSYSSIKDIITDRENGMLVAAFNNDEYIKAVEEIIENVDMRIMLAKNAMENVKKFHVDIIGKEWVRLFDKIKTQKINE